MGYQLPLPRDTFEHPPVEIDGVAVRTASPLALYQLRIGTGLRRRAGSHGPKGHRRVGRDGQDPEAG